MGRPYGVVTHHYMRASVVAGWFGLISDYIWLYLCLTRGSAGSMAFLFLMDSDICFHGWQEKLSAALFTVYNELYHSASKPKTERRVTPELIEILLKKVTTAFCRKSWALIWMAEDMSLWYSRQVGLSCVESVTKGKAYLHFLSAVHWQLKGGKG